MDKFTEMNLENELIYTISTMEEFIKYKRAREDTSYYLQKYTEMLPEIQAQ